MQNYVNEMEECEREREKERENIRKTKQREVHLPKANLFNIKVHSYGFIWRPGDDTLILHAFSNVKDDFWGCVDTGGNG